jgi:hypothetical protein
VVLDKVKDFTLSGIVQIFHSLGYDKSLKKLPNRELNL